MTSLIRDTIATRTLLVLFFGLSISHALSIALYLTDRTAAILFTGGEHVAERIATVHDVVTRAPPSDRQQIVALADQTRLHVTLTQQGTIDDQREQGWQAGVMRDALVDHLDMDDDQAFRLTLANLDRATEWKEHLGQVHGRSVFGEAMLVSFQLRNGTWLNFAAPIETPQPFWSLRFALSIAVMLIGVGILSIIVVRYLTKPLRMFARAAHRLGTDFRAPSIPERGPVEVREAARAFNGMQRRIQRFVEDRTQMLAAISHDLGTPITRLRLRAELVDDEEQQRKMLADLDDMEKMVFSSLSFARDEAADEPYAMVDLRTVLQRILDDSIDAGHAIKSNIGDTPIPFACRPVALRRALTNVVDNAIKYGGEAFISLDVDQQSILIRIDDRGPGIPDEFLEDAFKPFQRLEASRNRETGGTGLGLTVARTIVRAHGGDVILMNRRDGGLRVDVRLPQREAMA